MSERIYYLGIDPGISGGFSIVGNNRAAAWKNDVTEHDYLAVIEPLAPQIIHGYIELVHSRPTDGVVQAFTFGRSYGFLRGMLIALRIPFEEIRPNIWQKKMGCLTHGDKNVSKARAQQLFPTLRITHALADALLIAECCRRDCERPSSSGNGESDRCDVQSAVRDQGCKGEDERNPSAEAADVFRRWRT